MVEKAGVEVADNEEELMRATNGEVEDIRHVSDLGLDAAKAIRVLDEAIAACSRAVIVVVKGVWVDVVDDIGLSEYYTHDINKRALTKLPNYACTKERILHFSRLSLAGICVIASQFLQREI